MVSASTRRERLLARGLRAQERLLTSIVPADPLAWLELDLTMPQLKMLVDLATIGRARVGQLAQALNVGAPTASGIVERLLRRGLVARVEATDDRRVRWVELTDDGRRTVDHLFSTSQTQLRQLLEELETTALQTVAEALELLAEAAEKLPRPPVDTASPQ